MDITPLVESLRSKEYLAGLILGFAFVSVIGFVMQGAIPDIISAVSFSIVFTVAWLILDNISLLR